MIAAERFWPRVDKSGDCWIWLGAKGPQGYGTVSWRVDGRTTSTPAHRAAYQLAIGPIPEGHQVHHICGTRNCVRPEHLQALSPADHHEVHHPSPPPYVWPTDEEIELADALSADYLREAWRRDYFSRDWSDKRWRYPNYREGIESFLEGIR